MKKPVALAALVLALAASPVLAGDQKMTGPDGTVIKIQCTGSGCKVRGKKPGGKWGIVHKGPGGTQNYEKLVAEYTAKGFK